MSEIGGGKGVAYADKKLIQENINTPSVCESTL